MGSSLETGTAKGAGTVDLTRLIAQAGTDALRFAEAKTGGPCGQPAALAGRPRAAELYTYGWLKTAAHGLGELTWPLLSAHILPETDSGDPNTTDLVLVVEKATAALRLVCASLEDGYRREAGNLGFNTLIKVHVLTKGEASFGHALLGGFFHPAVQIWP